MYNLVQYIHDPSLVFFKLGKIGFFNWMSDKHYLEICFRLKMGKKLNLDAPKSFSEKIQWLKLYDRNPLYTKLVDKYEVKEIIANQIGKGHIIPTIGVWKKLEDIDFTAQKGKTTAIIGSTGSGKSTLVHLIPRFYDVTAGKITIDGVDVRDYTQENLREAIGFVPQKGVLFSGDIDSNLAFGCPDAPHEQLEKAAQIAQATEFITAKPDGFKSEISQGGTNVSGGQKQRLSIARAIAKKPKVLIFDDSFSALDFKTDVALRKALGENVTDATIIIVAQRIVTIMNADEIIVLDDGRIAGKGTHFELIGNCEVYDQIVKSQLSEEEYKKQLALAGRKGDE